jgi:hypothetical protein
VSQALRQSPERKGPLSGQSEKSASPAAAPQVSFDEKRIAQQKKEAEERKAVLRPPQGDARSTGAVPNGKPRDESRKERRARFWKDRKNRRRGADRKEAPHPAEQGQQRPSPMRMVALE